MRLVFAFPDVERNIFDDDAEWLLGELLAADPAAVALAERLQEAHPTGKPIKTTPAEKRKLLRIFERSTRPRSHDLRAFEVALHAAAFSEHHPP
jgi:hypothetical protein